MKKAITLILTLAMLLSLAACGNNSSNNNSSSNSSGGGSASNSSSENTEQTTKSYVDQVYIGEYSGATFINPTFDPTGCSGSICNNGCNFMIYDVLFYISSEGDYRSRVVENYEWTDDTHLVITIKDGIYFSNGDQLLGDDIIYSLGKRAESSMGSSYYQIYLLDQSTVSDDGLTITLVTESANSTYMKGLDFVIMDKDYVEGTGWDNIDWSDPDQVVGSGPYAISDFVSDSEIHFTKRDDYWGLSYGYDDTVKEYIVYNYSDRSTMSIDLETGVIDLAIDLNETDYSNLLTSGPDNIATGLIHSNVIISIAWDSTNNEYLKNDTIREALCYAADTEAMTLALNGSYGGVADSMLAPNELGYVSGYYYPHDVAKAKELLAEAGVSDGEIQLTILCYGNYETIATVLQSNLAEVGVDLDVQVVDLASYWGNVGGAGNSDLMMYGIPSSNPSRDPALHISYWKSTSAFAVMRRDCDDLIVAAETTLDTSERESLYQQLQKRWYENFDAIPVCEYMISFAYNTEVFNTLELSGTQSPWLFDADYVS
jgi:peptide/nickel transport system substrate-binding protein